MKKRKLSEGTVKKAVKGAKNRNYTGKGIFFLQRRSRAVTDIKDKISTKRGEYAMILVCFKLL